MLLNPRAKEVRRLLGQGSGRQQRVKPHLGRLGRPAGLALAQVMLETEGVRHTELAIEESWAWMLAGVGLLVVLVTLVPPRRRRVERLVES